MLIIGVALFGYGCRACSNVSTKEIAETPCSPVLPNGEKNAHYNNSWMACKSSCGYIKMPKLDIKTCGCTCI